MQELIPELRALSRLGACLHVESASAELVSWVNSHPLNDVVIRLADERGGQRWAEITLESPSESLIHLHIEVAIDGDTFDPKAQPTPDGCLGTVAEFIQRAHGVESSIGSMAELRVLLADLSDACAIKGLLNFAEQSCGSTLRLTEGRFAIEDPEEIFRHLSFRKQIDQGSDREFVVIELYSCSRIKLDADFLATLRDLLQLGLQCYARIDNATESSSK